MSVNGHVLDASAALALMCNEAGVEQVTKAFEAGPIFFSAINYSETIKRLITLGIARTEAAEALDALGTEIVPFDKETAALAGYLREETAALGLSLGDRACLALSRRMNLPALTADRAWGRLKLHPKPKVIR